MPQWYDITRKPEYQSLSPEDRATAKQQFFERFILPQIESHPELKGDEDVRKTAYYKFMQSPDDTGQGRFTSTLGAVGRGFGEVVPGAIQGLGALTGIEPLEKAGEAVRGGLEYISPVNPLYEDSVLSKGAATAGQIGSILATAGVGGAIGKGLAAQRIAAAAEPALVAANAINRGAKIASYGSAGLQGAASGAQTADQYGLTGAERYGNILAGFIGEIGSEMLPFGPGAETALAKKILTKTPQLGSFAGDVATEALEEGANQVWQNAALQALAPAGTKTPGLGEGVLESMGYGAFGGGLLGGINVASGAYKSPPIVASQLESSIAGVQANADVAPQTAALSEELKQPLPTKEAAPEETPSPSQEEANLERDIASAEEEGRNADILASQMRSQEEAAARAEAAKRQAEHEAMRAATPSPSPETAPEMPVQPEVAGAASPFPQAPSRPISENPTQAILQQALEKQTPTKDEYLQKVANQPQTTQENATLENPQQKVVSEERENGDQGRKAAETSGGNRVLSPKAGEEEVISPKRVRIAGEEFNVVSANADGTLHLSNDQGDEFDTNVGEKWTEVASVPKDRLAYTADEIRSMSKAEFIRKEIDRAEFSKKLAIRSAEDAIRNNFKPSKKLPVGVSKVTAILTKPRLNEAEKKLVADYRAAQRQLGAADAAEISRVKGAVWDQLNAKPITPQGKPTTATEGTSMPGGSGERLSPPSPDFSGLGASAATTPKGAIESPTALMERDASKPEQMTPEEWHPVGNPVNQGIFKSKRDALTRLAELQEAIAKNPQMMAILSEFGLSSNDAYEVAKSEYGKWSIGATHQHKIAIAARDKLPVSAAAVDSYGIKLPEGYTRQGELYVYNPGATGEPVQAAPFAAQVGKSTAPGPVSKTTSAAANETAAPSAKEAAAAIGASSSLEGGRSSELPRESPKTAIESTEKSLAELPAEELIAKLDDINNLPFARHKIQQILTQELDRLPQSKRAEIADALGTKANSKAIAADIMKQSRFVEKGLEDIDPALRKQREDEEEMQRQAALSIARIFDGLRTNPKYNQVSRADAAQAAGLLSNNGTVPGAAFTWQGTSEELLALEGTPFAESFPKAINAARWNSKARPGQPSVEGIYEKGTSFVFFDRVVVTDLDVRKAAEAGVSPSVAAAMRVITEENYHLGIARMEPQDQAAIMAFLRKTFTPAELDALALQYRSFADWRSNPSHEMALLDERLQKHLAETKTIPADGPWKEFWELIKAIWRKWTGKPKGEPTFESMKDVVRLIRKSLKDSLKARADETKSGGRVILGDAQYSYAGERAQMSQMMRDSLETAKAMAAAGKTSEEIRAVTGWFPGKYDGKMRFEIPSNSAVFREKISAFQRVKNWAANKILENPEGEMRGIPISQVLDYPEFFSAYPKAKNIKVDIEERNGAAFDPETNTIHLSMDSSSPEKLSSILHELQHWTQTKEGFAYGARPKTFGIPTKAQMDEYLRAAGEIEARDVQARQNLTPEQRAAIAPYSSENIAPEDAIVMFSGNGPQLSLHNFFTQAVNLDGRVETGATHYEAWIKHVLRQLPAYQKDGLSERERFELADQWLVKHHEFLSNSKGKEGFMTPEGFMDRQEAFKKFKGMGGIPEMAPNEPPRDWLDSSDVEGRYSLSGPLSNEPSPGGLTEAEDIEDNAPGVFQLFNAIMSQSDPGNQFSDEVSMQRPGFKIAGFFLGASPDAVRGYGDRIKQLAVTITKPLALDKETYTAQQFAELLQREADVWPDYDRETASDLKEPVYTFFSPGMLANPFDSREIAEQLTKRGYDAVVMWDDSAYEQGKRRPTVWIPYTKAANIKVVPPESSRAGSPPISYASETDEAGSLGQQTGRALASTPRQLEALIGVRKAYEAMPKTHGLSVALDELFAKSKELVPSLTRPEFDAAVQGLFEDNAALFDNAENPTSVVVLPNPAMMSLAVTGSNSPSQGKMGDPETMTPEMVDWALTHLDGRNLQEAMGVTQQLVSSPAAAKRWYGMLVEKVRTADALKVLNSMYLEMNEKPVATVEYDLPPTVYDVGDVNRMAPDQVAWILNNTDGRDRMDLLGVSLAHVKDVSLAEGWFRVVASKVAHDRQALREASMMAQEMGVEEPESIYPELPQGDARYSLASSSPEAKDAIETFKDEIISAAKGMGETAEYQGKPIKAKVANPLANERDEAVEVEPHEKMIFGKFLDAAEKLISTLEKDGMTLEEIYEKLKNPAFQQELGLFMPEAGQGLAATALTGILTTRTLNATRKGMTKADKIRANALHRDAVNFYTQLSATPAGQLLRAIQFLQSDPRTRFLFLETDRQVKMLKNAGRGVNRNFNGGYAETQKVVGDAVVTSGAITTENMVKEAEDAAEDDQDAIDLAAGEATLTDPDKTIYEQIKDDLRAIGFLQRLEEEELKAASAQASLSKAERNFLSSLTPEQRKAEIAKRTKRVSENLRKLVGEESDAKTPEAKAARAKRTKMVATAKKRAEKGKAITPPPTNKIEEAEATARAILKDLSERYSDPIIHKDGKKPNVNEMRELYKKRVQQGVGANHMTEKAFTEKAMELGADELTAGVLWKAAELEIDAREAMRQDRMLDRQREAGKRADAQAQRIIFAKERLKRQSGFADIDKHSDRDTIIKAFSEQVEKPVSLEDFSNRLLKLNVSREVAARVFKAAEREAADQKAMKAFRMLEGPDALKNMIREISAMRPSDTVPLSKRIPWRKLLSQKASDVESYRQQIFAAIATEEALSDLSGEQKAKLAKLFSEAWSTQREKVLSAMLEAHTVTLAKQNKERAAKALRESRNQIIEAANLGVFSNDELTAVLGDKFGFKTKFTEEEKAKLSDLAERYQNEQNPAKKVKLGHEFLSLLESGTQISIPELLANWWTGAVLTGGNTLVSIGLSFSNGTGIGIFGTHLTRALRHLVHGEIPQAIDAITSIYKGYARNLRKMGDAGRRAWHYLWTGDRSLLESAANDPFKNVRTLAEIERHHVVADAVARDPNKVKAVMGRFMQFSARLLTALDAFNVISTKAGMLSLAMRQSGLSATQIEELERKASSNVYREQVIRDEFGGKVPTSSLDKALLNSMAEAAMYKDMAELGVKMENADFLAAESAMTLDPTGFGGMVYKKIRTFDKEITTKTRKGLEMAEKDWLQAKDQGTDLQAYTWGKMFAWRLVNLLAEQGLNIVGLRFARFAGNKFNQSLSYIPGIGLLRQLEKDNPQLEKHQEAFADSLLRNQLIGLVVGGIGIAMIKAITDEPDDEKRGWAINGGWNNLTPDQKKQKLSRGEKQYTIRIGDHVFNYQNWPIGQVIAAVGEMSDLIRYSPQKWKEKSGANQITSAIVAGMTSALEIPALTQVGELFSNSMASKDPTEQTVNRLTRVMSGWAGGFVPRFVKDIDYMANPEMRKYTTFWEKTAAHIPVYRSYVGKEYYDILGNQIKKNAIPGSRDFDKLSTEPEYKLLGALNARGIWLTPANAEYRMVGKGLFRRRLTQEEADKYSLETGKLYKKMLLNYGPRVLQMPLERAKDFISAKADDARDIALMRAIR